MPANKATTATPSLRVARGVDYPFKDSVTANKATL